MFKGEEAPRRRKSGGGVFGIFRTFLSLIMLLILALGLYLAYRNFSGYDPLKLDPQSLVRSVLSSDSVYKIVNTLLSYGPDKSLVTKLNLKPPATIPRADNQAHHGALKYKFAIMADSHRDNQNLQKALSMAKQFNVKYVIAMGDFSDVGTTDELVNTKRSYDAVNIPYYATPGDHDQWDARNQKKGADSNFLQVFHSPTYQSFADSGVRNLIIYNSDDYLGLDQVQLKWVEDEVSRVSTEKPQLFFAFVDTPLYHPSSDHVMGRVEPKLKDQADHLLSILQKAGVNEIFSADTHFFSRFIDPTTGVKITTVGAITADRNPQAPRFAIVDVYSDASYNVEEVEIK